MTNVYDAYDRRIASMWKDKVTDEDGNEVHDRVVPDRGVVRVPLQFMDNKSVKDHQPAPYQHAANRPHEVAITDDERERRQKAVADYNAKISNAWRNPPGAEQ